MRAGRLQQLLTIQQPTETTGDAVVTWGDLTKIQASVRGDSIEMRYNRSVHDAWIAKKRLRVIDQVERVLDIGSMEDPDGRRQQLNIIVTELP